MFKERARLFAALDPSGNLETTSQQESLRFDRYNGLGKSGTIIQFPTGIQNFLRVRENSFDRNSQLPNTRFVRFDEQVGRHHLTQQMNLSNTQVAAFCRFRKRRACLRPEQIPDRVNS